MPAAHNFGILDEAISGGMAYDTRAYFQGLIHAGMDPQIAKQLALAFQQANRARKSVVKSRGVALGEQVKKAGYHEHFYAESKKQLPDWQHKQVVTAARAKAGAQASTQTRQRRARVKALMLSAMRGEGDTGGPKLLRPAPQPKAAPPPPDDGEAFKSATPVTKRCAQRLIEKTMQVAGEEDLAETNPQLKRLLDAQRLVSGMDAEMMDGATSAAEARARACRALGQQMGAYDRRFEAPGDPQTPFGLRLDLGSGEERAAGFLGLDDQPYDYGTMVWSTDDGLPCPPQSVQVIRLVNSLASLPVDPSIVVSEVQNALMYGGVLLYQGNRPLSERVDMDDFPGMHQISADDESGREVWQRIQIQVPSVFGAEPNSLGATEQGAGDIDRAQMLMGMAAQPETLMANLLGRGERLAKADASAAIVDKPMKRYVLSVVYAPDELDTDNEYMDAEDIEWAAHQCMINGAFIGSEHGGIPTGARIVESYIAPADFFIDSPGGSQFVPKGSWLMGILFDDEDEWQKVLSGEYRGFSLGGFALRGQEEDI